MRILQRRLVRVAAAAVAVVGWGAVIVAPQSAQASIVPFLVDFDPAPFGGFTAQFATDGFTFTFAGGGDFVASPLGGEPLAETRSIQADSNPVDADIEIITIELSGGGPFTFDSIHINSVAGGATTVAGFDAGGQIYSSLVAAVFTGVEPSNSGLPVIRVELRSADFFSLRFDSFAGDLPMVGPVSAVPLPAALPLFGSALAMLGIVGWRRKRRAAA